MSSFITLSTFLLRHFSHSCCDSRRAVIIVECIFGIAFNAIGIGLLLTAANISTMFDDDGFGNELARESIITSIIYGVGVLVSFVTICGAVNFKVPLVAVGIVWTVCQTITDVVLQAQSYSEAGLRYPIIDAVIRISVAGLLLYPSAVFVAECRSGIMSRQNYAKEQYSCCCV